MTAIDITQITPSEYCLGCSGCCRFDRQDGPWSPHLLRDEEGLADSVRTVPARPGLGADFACSAFGEGSRCSVYGKRPLECRLYPFLINRRKEGLFLSVDERCPFIAGNGAGAAIDAYAAGLLSLLRSNRRMLEENLDRFPAYEGVRDLGAIFAVTAEA